MLMINDDSTVVYMVKRLGQLVREKNFKLVCVPSSFQAKQLILGEGLHLSSLEQHPIIDIAIDGADECDVHLNLIKGGGGAQTQEKILAFNSKDFVVIADYTKQSNTLGQVDMSFILPSHLLSSFLSLLSLSLPRSFTNFPFFWTF